MYIVLGHIGLVPAFNGVQFDMALFILCLLWHWRLGRWLGCLPAFAAALL